MTNDPKVKRTIGRGLAGAGAGNLVSAALALARDGLVVIALGTAVASDRFFLLFAVFQLSYGFLVGGTRVVLVQRELSARRRGDGSWWVGPELRAASRDYLGPALRLACGVNALAALGISRSLDWGTATSLHLVIAVTVATWLRGKAEFASLPAILKDRLGFVSIANALQNAGLVVVALALAVAELRDLPLIWWGVAFGYALNLFVLALGGTTSTENPVPETLRPEINWRAGSRTGPLWLGGGLAAILGLPVLEQLVLNAAAPGLASVAAISRRIISAPPAILCAPLGNSILNHAGNKDAQAKQRASDRMWTALGVLGAGAFALTVALCASTWLFRTQLQAVLDLTPALARDLALFSWAALLGSLCQVLQAVSGRASQAHGNFRSPTMHVLLASSIHAVGIVLAAFDYSFVLIALCYSLGWAAASIAELRDLSGYMTPPPGFIWEGILAMLGLMAFMMVSTRIGGGGTEALAVGASLAAALGFAWVLLAPSRHIRDRGWL